MVSPKPLVLDANSWAGNDGNWSTWPILVGTPPQLFNVLPATSHGEIWIPLPEGCPSSSNLSYPGSCGASRGVGDIEGAQSSGYQQNASSTWNNIGIYALPVQAGLFEDDQNGLYGTETVSIDDGTGSLELPKQGVAGIATQDFWLGSLGVAQRAANFTVEEAVSPSFLDVLEALNMSSSASFGLDVGASYDNAPGSLVIGGFDKGALEAPSITVSDVANLALTVFTRSIVLSNTLQGTVSVTHDLLSMPVVIDSAVSQLWLPQVVCDELEASLGLTYDPSTELYVVNSTAHRRLLDLAPEIAFTLAADSTSNQTTSIVLPYAALDLRAGPPIYNVTTNYFPLRRANKQSVLGRAFLQEAYLVVDWDRSNFTISQAAPRGNRTRDIVPIHPPSDAPSSSGLSTGAIVGIVVGAVVFAISVVALLWRKLRKHDKWPQIESEPAKDRMSMPPPYTDNKDMVNVESDPKGVVSNDSIQQEAMSTPVYELHEEEMAHQLMGDSVRYELPTDAVGPPELEARSGQPDYRPYRPDLEARNSQ